VPINKNHEFEELDGIKCAIVEKNTSPERVEFLRKILEYNNYTVVVVSTPPPKTAAVPPKPAVPPGDAQPMPPLQAEAPPPQQTPTTFTVGVTDVTFNPINAIFGRLLQTPGNRIVTLAYWQQKEDIPNDEVPYFQNKVYE
jgi:hypothetical protein